MGSTNSFFGGAGGGNNSSSSSYSSSSSNKSSSNRSSRRRGGPHEELMAGGAFCLTSAGMTLLNKAALSSYSFSAPTSLLAFQCSVTLLLVWAAYAVGASGSPPRLSRRLLVLWLPVNVLFVGMVVTSFYALAALGVAMVTVLKNLTNFAVITCDYVFFGKRYGLGVWATLLLMAASALAAGATDLAFDANGYAWQMANNAFTAAYSLALRGVIVRTTALTRGSSSSSTAGAAGSGGGAVDELGMVVYNNLLSVPMIAALALASGDLRSLASEPALRSPGFVAAALTSAVLSFLISVASMWFLSCTTATTFSLVGSLNKIPLALLGMMLFRAPTSINNLASVLLGLAAGAAFAHAKASEAARGGMARSRSGSWPGLPLHAPLPVPLDGGKTTGLWLGGGVVGGGGAAAAVGSGSIRGGPGAWRTGRVLG
jgi:GDP-mannose transporter